MTSKCYRNKVKTISSIFLCLSTAEILQANDSLTQVINQYKQQVKGEIVNGNNTLNAQKQTGGWSTERRNTQRVLNRLVFRIISDDDLNVQLARIHFSQEEGRHF